MPYPDPDFLDWYQQLIAGQPNRVLQPGAGTRPVIQWMKENATDPDAARLQNAVRPRIDPDYIASGEQIRSRIGAVPQSAMQASNTKGGKMDEYEDYVRAMAYGPSQGEFTHDTLNGPFGRLQPGDIAISPDLQKRYPLGSYIKVQPKEGDPIVGRVADHSYYTPGNPTKNSIEIWNGQDLGHATISPSPAPSGLTSPSRDSLMAGVPAPVSGGGYAAGVGSNPAGMSTMQDYGSAIERGQQMQNAGLALGNAMQQAAQSMARQQQTGNAQALQMLSGRPRNLAAYAPVPAVTLADLLQRNQYGG